MLRAQFNLDLGVFNRSAVLGVCKKRAGAAFRLQSIISPSFEFGPVLEAEPVLSLKLGLMVRLKLGLSLMLPDLQVQLQETAPVFSCC